MNDTERKRRLYIAGPMSGIPDLNYPLFNEVAEFYRAEGYHVENPAENTIDASITDSFLQWQEFMRLSIAQLITCDVVAVLPDYLASRGAALEVHIAKAIGLTIFEERLLRATFTRNPYHE